VLDRIGQGLAGDEVGGGLDLVVEALRRRLDFGVDRGPGGELREGSGETVIEGRRADAAGELAQLLDRLGQTRDHRVQRRLCLSPACLVELVLDVAELEAERDEALLRSVVEVALEAAALLVGRGDDPGPRLLDLSQLAADLDPEPGDLDREPRVQDHRVEQARRLEQRGVVEDGRELQLTAPDGRSAGWSRRQLGHQASRRVGVNLVVGQPEEELQARVRSRLGEHVADSLRLGPADAEIAEEAVDLLQPLVTRPVEAPIHQRL
jgi:hypothetical protein